MPGSTYETGRIPRIQHRRLTRREFLTIIGAAGLAFAGAPSRSVWAQTPAAKADAVLRIGPVRLELAPGRIVQTAGYNGAVPGPILCFREGQQATIEVRNDTGVPELVHWHGLFVPPEVDGAMEEGTPMVMPGQTATYTFTAKPVGTRWYRSHAVAGKDLTHRLYSGQSGFLAIEPTSEPGRYDQEVFLAMHQWEPYFYSVQDRRQGPPPDNGLEVGYKSASFNDTMLGHGEPIRVRQGQRVLFRLLNANATGVAQWQAPPMAMWSTCPGGGPRRSSSWRTMRAPPCCTATCRSIRTSASWRWSPMRRRLSPQSFR